MFFCSFDFTLLTLVHSLPSFGSLLIEECMGSELSRSSELERILSGNVLERNDHARGLNVIGSDYWEIGVL